MKILVAGDYVPVGRVARKVNAGDYDCFEPIKQIITSADYSIVNLECPVVDHDAQPIQKIGPNIKCTPNGVAAVRYAGFDCVTLANNHFRDFGDEGVEQTIRILDNQGVMYIGGGKSLEEAARVFYKAINGKTLAVINCCENEFSIATSTSAGSNPLNPIKQYYAIQEACKKSDYVLVIVHGGHEHWQLPSPRMQDTYRFFIDAGADAVVNHHQHCYSGYEVYKGKPIFYGLGNFCFDTLFANTPAIWYEGYMVLIEFEQGDIHFDLVPYQQCKEKAEVRIIESEDFKKKIDALNRIIEDPVLLNQRFIEYCKIKKDIMIADIMAPVGNKFLLAAARRHILPIFLSKKRLLRVVNNIRCESHKDILLKSLGWKIDEK